MNAGELFACSLCGGRGIVRSIDPRHRREYRFKCTNCGLCNERFYQSKEEAAEAWNALHAPKWRTIESITVPPGYTIVPAKLFRDAVEILRTSNIGMFRKLVKYNIWHPNTPEVDGSFNGTV